mmetsp:Transcript_16951/g.42333  ORF Transcript_16951/g.42333 Transcript_16951/m.42333 type:complete len:120 (-) Transcript_16951:138-497(-)
MLSSSSESLLTSLVLPLPFGTKSSRDEDKDLRMAPRLLSAACMSSRSSPRASCASDMLPYGRQRSLVLLVLCLMLSSVSQLGHMLVIVSKDLNMIQFDSIQFRWVRYYRRLRFAARAGF